MTREQHGMVKRAGLKTLLPFLLFVVVLAAAGCRSQEPTATPEPQDTPTIIPLPATATASPAPAVPTLVPPGDEGTATPTAADETMREALQDVLWVLVGYGDVENSVVVPEGTVMTATFDADGSVSGSAGCNNYRADYQVGPDGALTVSGLGTTEAVCAQGMEGERAFLQGLENAASFRFTEQGRLQISYPASDPARNYAMTFVPGERPLVATPWVLLSYGSPEAATLVQQGTATTALFTPDAAGGTVGTLTGFGGCNDYQTRYLIDGVQIRFDPPISTRVACPLGMEQEEAFFSALATAREYRLVGSLLEIYYAGGVLTLSARSLPLEDVAWTLIALQGQPVSEMPVVVLFEPDGSEGGRVRGVVGCLTYAATYTARQGALHVTPPYVTGTLCSETYGQEQQFLDALAGASGYAMYGEQLGLKTPLGTMAFTAFRARLTQIVWQLTGTGPIDDLQPLAPETSFRVTFVRRGDTPSGTLIGDSPCSTYSAPFTASLDEIKINLPATAPTQSCPTDLLQQQQAFFLLLNDVSRYRILGNQLQLIAGEQALAFSVATTDETDAVTPPAGTDLSSLDGTTWYLMSFHDQTPLSGTGLTAQFAIDAGGSTGTIGGSAGCNAYSATIGEGFAIGPAAVTGQLCAIPPGVMEQEQAYLAALPTVTGFSLTNGQLLLTTPGGLLVYSATPPQPPVDQAGQLQNRTWYLVTHSGIAAVAGAEATVRFESTGALSGSTGCNTFSGNYRTDGPRLSTEALSATSAACAAPLGDQDTAMLAALDTANSYQIDATQLRIFAGSGILTFSATAPIAGGSLTPVIVMPASGLVGQVITFDGTQSSHSRPIIKYVWFFGDGAQAFGPAVQHAYGNPGTYVVELQVADDRGETATITQQIQITGATPFVSSEEEGTVTVTWEGRACQGQSRPLAARDLDGNHRLWALYYQYTPFRTLPGTRVRPMI